MAVTDRRVATLRATLSGNLGDYRPLLHGFDQTDARPRRDRVLAHAFGLCWGSAAGSFGAIQPGADLLGLGNPEAGVQAEGALPLAASLLQVTGGLVGVRQAVT